MIRGEKSIQLVESWFSAIYSFAIASLVLQVVGIIMAGWSRNN